MADEVDGRVVGRGVGQVKGGEKRRDGEKELHCLGLIQGSIKCVKVGGEHASWLSWHDEMFTYISNLDVIRKHLGHQKPPLLSYGRSWSRSDGVSGIHSVSFCANVATECGLCFVAYLNVFLQAVTRRTCLFISLSSGRTFSFGWLRSSGVCVGSSHSQTPASKRAKLRSFLALHDLILQYRLLLLAIGRSFRTAP